ncbi:hypothetical protein Golomagni_06175 [Golovinomyces magnicellulatus]|nr:hypothetical protein Golomagni_06175 [Golovinomyces magnicellulatus]
MSKDRITCHVLDTTAGRPAEGIQVRLVGPSSASFHSKTDADGRIKLWTAEAQTTSKLEDILSSTKGASRWELHFDTEAYFGAEKTFFPEAIVVFRVDEGQTYHVPLLLSPYTYTTYRGS